MAQELERERAAEDLAPVGAVIAAAADPAAPPVERRGEAAVGVRTQARQDADPAIGVGEREIAPVALLEVELAAKRFAQGIGGQRHVAVQQGEAAGVLAAPDPGAAPPQVDRRAPEIGPGREADLEPDLPRDALHDAEQLAVRTELTGLRHRHQVGHACAAARGLEAALEHRGVVEIPAPDSRGVDRPKREVAAAPLIKQAGEQGGRGEGRRAQPVDRAGPGDQRCGPAVADHRVVADRGIARASTLPAALLAHVFQAWRSHVGRSSQVPPAARRRSLPG
jgi:hypothetical protein